MESGKRGKPFGAAAELSSQFLIGLCRVEDPVSVNIELAIMDFLGKRNRIGFCDAKKIINCGGCRCRRAEINGAGMSKLELRTHGNMTKLDCLKRLFWDRNGMPREIRQADEDCIQLFEIRAIFCN